MRQTIAHIKFPKRLSECIIFALGIGTGLLFCNLTRSKAALAQFSKLDSANAASSSGYGPARKMDAALSDMLDSDLSRLVAFTEIPNSELDEFRIKIEDGRVDSGKLALFLEILAERWPESVLEFVNTINPKVASALRLKSIALCKLAGRHADIAVKLLSKSSIDDFDGRELYDIGLQFLKNGTLSAEQISKLGPDMSSALNQAEAESILRREGVAGLVSWISGLKNSTLKEYDTKGNLVFEKSNTTSFALDRLSQFLKETSSANGEEIFLKLSNPSFSDNSIELSGAFKVLAEIDPAKALAVASSLKIADSFAAERGAFSAAAKSSPEIALNHLTKTTDITKQNLMLTLLEAYTTDIQIRSECQELLSERGLPISQNSSVLLSAEKPVKNN